MDPNHFDAAFVREMDVEFESLQAAASPILFKLNLEVKPSAGSKLDLPACQLGESPANRLNLNNLFVRVPHPPTIDQEVEVVPDLPSQYARRVQGQRGQVLFCFSLAVICQANQFVFGVQADRPPNTESGVITKTSTRRLRRLGAALSTRSANSRLANSKTAPPRVSNTTLRSID